MDEFVEYYTNISASIDDDMYFQAMMNSAWNLSGDAATYKSFGKGWASEEKRPQTAQSVGGAYQRKNVDPTGQPTLRSGLSSSDFPFGDSQARFYERQGSPPRQSLANPKHYKEPERSFK